MSNRDLCVTDEWYHCYNRGTDKRIVFESSADYERFMTLLYVSNGTTPVRISDQRSNDLHSFLANDSIDRGEPLVEIGAYALMSNHPHLVLKQVHDNGIARFMQKVFTGYTMYFNLKRSRTGALFAGTYKYRHVANDDYLKQLIAYVLLNPVELFESHWKEGVADLDKVEKELRSYRYSSLPDFLGETRPENKIIRDLDEYYDVKPRLAAMLSDALAYHREHAPEV